jgi:hypothetical protein
MTQECQSCCGSLVLLRQGTPRYAWQCAQGCLPPIDTGVSISEDIGPFEKAAVRNDDIDFSIFTRHLSAELVPGAKAYMLQILPHFIECTRGGCYNSIYNNLLAPHLDSPDVVDYVLRGPVIHGSPDLITGITGAKIFEQLLWCLKGVHSPNIRQYIQVTFEVRH